MKRRTIRALTVLGTLCLYLSAPAAASDASLETPGRNQPVSEIGHTEGDQRQGMWEIKWEDGRTASGPYVNDKRHGPWTERRADGRTAVGEYKHGVRHGLWILNPLRFIYRNIDRASELYNPEQTVGEQLYINGLQVGPSRIYFHDMVGSGSMLSQEGLPQGPWRFRWAYGRRENSLWVDGVRQGRATIVWRDGSSEEGDYLDGKRDGVWTLAWWDGTREQGSYTAGKRSGLWRTQYGDGHWEEGTYEEGKRAGYWKVQWPDGATAEVDYTRSSEGQWTIRNQNSRAGQVVPDGKEMLKEGVWEIWKIATDDEHHETERCPWAPKYAEYCKGEFFRDLRVGLWVVRPSTGHYYKVTYTRGRLTGPAEIRYPDGTVWSGQYADGSRAGVWRFRTPQGIRGRRLSQGDTGELWTEGIDANGHVFSRRLNREGSSTEPIRSVGPRRIPVIEGR